MKKLFEVLSKPFNDYKERQQQKLEEMKKRDEDAVAFFESYLLKPIGDRTDLTLGNVVLVSDRLTRLAARVGECLNQFDGTNVIGVVTNQRMAYKITESVDLLIIVGYLEYCRNYYFKNQNEDMQTVFFATPSRVVKDQADILRIEHIFDRMSPTTELYNYLEMLTYFR